MTYVMSDIHGNMRRFNSVMRQINLQPDDTLYILGDVIDRHPDGIRILRKIMDAPNIKMILGNHEYMMLRAIGRPYDAYEQTDDLFVAEQRELWYRNGGYVTHSHWKRLKKDLRERIIQYLQGLPLNYDFGVNDLHYKLVHGAPTEEYKYFQKFHPTPTHFSVWKRWRFFEELHGDYILVFGHTPTIEYTFSGVMEIWFGNRRIGIDCGSGLPEKAIHPYYEFGRLSCLRLDDMKEFYSEENYNEERS